MDAHVHLPRRKLGVLEHSSAILFFLAIDAAIDVAAVYFCGRPPPHTIILFCRGKAACGA